MPRGPYKYPWGRFKDRKKRIASWKAYHMVRIGWAKGAYANRPTRLGVQNGSTRKKDQKKWAEAAIKTEKFLKMMEDEGLI